MDEDLVRFVRRLLATMQGEVTRRDAALAEGTYSTLESYREAVGERRGYKRAMSEVVGMLSAEAREELNAST